MNKTTDTESVKRHNIIDMALTFTATMRVFSVGSKARIARKLEEAFAVLERITSAEEYEALHAAFCQWFTQEITTAEKELKNGEIKPSRNASYGHAAKILDICAKVYVYYCGLPSSECAKRLTPLLHGAVDTPILKELGKRFRGQIYVSTVEEIVEATYKKLQDLIAQDIARSFQGSILPVQYDDILWAKLNR